MHQSIKTYLEKNARYNSVPDRKRKEKRKGRRRGRGEEGDDNRLVSLSGAIPLPII